MLRKKEIISENKIRFVRPEPKRVSPKIKESHWGGAIRKNIRLNINNQEKLCEHLFFELITESIDHLGCH